MFRRRLLFFLLGPALAVIAAQNDAFSATSSVEFKLRGILISTTNRSALVNGKVVREGERIDGIEILTIEEDVVRVLSGSGEYAVPVGSGAWLQPSPVRSVHNAEIDKQSNGDETRQHVRRVNSGDTLSGIAEEYVSHGISLNQVMVALFKANPQAFDGNLNRLHAGADLYIPEDLFMRRLDPEAALAEVVNQTRRWQAVRNAPAAQPTERIETRPVRLAVTSEPSEYGPVRFGETLSQIAVEVSGTGVSMDEMMAALFAANPHAFGDSIDLLHEGAVLRVPGIDEINQVQTLAANHYR